MPEKLRAYIDGTKFGRREGHTRFDDLLALSYNPESYEPLSLVRDRRSKNSKQWGQLHVSHARDYQMHGYADNHIEDFLVVQPGKNSKLDVRLAGIKLWFQPLAVSLSTEQKEGDSEPKVMVVIEHPDSTKIDEWFESPELCSRFPRNVTKYPEALGKKLTRDDSHGNRILFITKDVNLPEMWRDREQLKQTFVVGTPHEADACILALTKGEIRL